MRHLLAALAFVSTIWVTATSSYAAEPAQEGALLRHFLRFQGGWSVSQVKAALPSSSGCTLDASKRLLSCPVKGFAPFSEVKYEFLGQKLYAVRLRVGFVATWGQFVKREAAVRRMLQGIGTFTEVGKLPYSIAGARKRLHQDRGTAASGVMFTARERREGELIGKLLGFRRDGKQGYGFELSWLPSRGAPSR